MMSSFGRCCLVGFLGLGLAVLARADVSVPAFFSDHAVLQKSDKVPIWGKAPAGEKVTVTLDKATASATAGDDGKWKVELNLHSEGPGPYSLVVQGKNLLTFTDVLVGEVWVCGGQSNMDFPLGAFPVAKTEVPQSANPLLRQFKVKFNPSPVPVDDVQGKWVEASPETSGQFSAVGYFFGKKLQKTLGVPVGLMNDCLGGTVIETWMSAEALASDPDLKAGADKAQKDRKAFDDFGTQYIAWQKQYGREDHPAADPNTFADPGINTSDWKPVTLPGTFSAAGLPDAGAIWIRKTVPVPGSPGTDILPNKGIDLYLDDVRDSDDVYWNGKKIGSSPVTATNHRYGIHPNLVQPADSTLAVRVFNPAGGAGIARDTASLFKGRFQGNHLMLTGQWLAKAEYALPPLDATAQAALPIRPKVPYDPQNVAAYLFNGMINPIIPYAIAGVIWYQGEGNYNHGYQYRTEFPALINDWRAKWGQGNFPFYFCQIANNHGHPTVPVDDPAAELREAQTMTLSVPNTGEAILIDIGEENNIHPADKMDVGDRLARIALANTYGEKVVYSGPVYDSMTIEGDKVRLHFQHAEGGLVVKPLPATYQPLSTDPKTVPVVRNTPDSELEGFAICGDDRQWKWANAKIDGDTVLVWSTDVPKPVAVRYAWAFNPWCNLYNGAGLPAGPFRTDDFPLLSLKLRYGDPAH
jgi:sialate O-acetylesterase